jgi:hypothetical protein
MRSVWLSLLALATPLLGVAQGMMPSVTNLSGFDGTVNNFTITSSIGEPIITTLTSQNVILTQGFLQPEVLPCLDVRFSYYPNPATDEITVEAFGCEVRIESIQLIDLWGRVLPGITLGKNNKVKLKDLSQGVYLMQVFLTNGTSQAIKVLKVEN